MTFPFVPGDFADGSKPGSDPYDNPNPKYQRPHPQSSSTYKATAANALVAFLESGCKVELFTEQVYDALSQHMFGHVAEFTRHGFYGSWFERPDRRAQWVERVRSVTFADQRRPRLWGDVEQMVVAWLDSSGVGDRLIAEGRPRTPFETFEVALVAELPVADGPSTECERILDPGELPGYEEQATGFLFTVYGWRQEGGHSSLSIATAISDFPAEGPRDPKARKAAQDLAYALADGKPVQDNTDVLDA